jgi:uncharacterized protein YhbP (UPF0306 family)
MEVKDLLTTYLNNNQVLHLATVADGQPQICSVHFAFDEQFNFYWLSSRLSHHSQAIEQDGRAVIAILQSPTLIQCIHAEGQARALADDEMAQAHEIYSQRFGANPERLHRLTTEGRTTEAIYLFKPDSLVLIDAANFPQAPRQEYSL